MTDRRLAWGGEAAYRAGACCCTGKEKMNSAPKIQKPLGFVVCTDAAGNEMNRQGYFNEAHAEALERDCKRRSGNPNRIQAP